MQEDQDNERESGDVAAYAEVDQAWLMGAIESMLFVTDEPVGVLTFADMLQVDPARVQESLVCLQRELEQAERGIQLREVAGGWRLYTHPRYHELIERYVLSWDTRKLSQAALETLAVVAYCQPITRNGVASVRGVSSDSSINSLVEKGLLREAGTQDVIQCCMQPPEPFWKNLVFVRYGIFPLWNRLPLTRKRAPLSPSA